MKLDWPSGAEDRYPQRDGGASADVVRYAAGDDGLSPAGVRERQVSMRPTLEKQKQVPSKRIPAKRTPTLQIELELPRGPAEELEERAPAREEASERGVMIVDFYI